MNRTAILAVAAIIFLAALSRILPHPPNLTPVAAMALFGGAYAATRAQAFLFPLAALFVSDMVIGLHGGMLLVYATMMLIVCIGLLLRTRVSPLRVAGASLAASVLFFLLTNCVFLHVTHDLYPRTLEGQMQSYVAALPFFRNTLLGDLFYSALMFGGFAWLKRSLPALSAR